MTARDGFEEIPPIRLSWLASAAGAWLSIMTAAFVLAIGPSFAQQSANYRQKEHAFNEGGNPAGGIILTSPRFKVTIDSVGEGLLGASLASPTFRADGGLVPAYPPPGEVHGLFFQDDHTTLVWSPEASVGTYNVYRGLVSALSGGECGACKDHGLGNETTTETDVPTDRNGYFYLVTAVNRLGEEGTKGFRSDRAERPNPSPCP